jgi:hypothetical protein
VNQNAHRLAKGRLKALDQPAVFPLTGFASKHRLLTSLGEGLRSSGAGAIARAIGQDPTLLDPLILNLVESASTRPNDTRKRAILSPEKNL